MDGAVATEASSKRNAFMPSKRNAQRSRLARLVILAIHG